MPLVDGEGGASGGQKNGPAIGDEFLQCAGRAEAMTVEVSIWESTAPTLYTLGRVPPHVSHPEGLVRIDWDAFHLHVGQDEVLHVIVGLHGFLLLCSSPVLAASRPHTSPDSMVRE
jgi:hypothetical protein